MCAGVSYRTCSKLKKNVTFVLLFFFSFLYFSFRVAQKMSVCGLGLCVASDKVYSDKLKNAHILIGRQGRRARFERHFQKLPLATDKSHVNSKLDLSVKRSPANFQCWRFQETTIGISRTCNWNFVRKKIYENILHFYCKKS